MRMPKELKKKWLTALRSGNYKQGRGRLYSKETKSFCCLGVLQHIVMDGNVESVRDYHSGNLIPGFTPSRKFYIDNKIDINYDGKSLESRLIQLNDNGHTYFGTTRLLSKGFEDIADFIEKNVKEY